MANWNGLQLTNKGIALQAKVQAGEQLHITKLKLGSGVVPSNTDIKTLTDLITPEQNLGIGAKEAVGEYCKISSTISNTGLETGYYVRELGVFAQDPDVGEILYMYATDGAPDYLPAGGGSTVISQEFNVMVAVDDAENVTVDIDPAALATMGYVQLKITEYDAEHNADENAHNDMVGATTDAAGTRGMVPAPAAGAANRYFCSDGTYKSVATTEQAKAGTDDTAPMTALKVKQALEAAGDVIAVGDVVYRPYLKSGYVKANGATVLRSDYPTLAAFATEQNLWTETPTDEPWKYGVGDGSTTMVLPDYRGRVIQGGDSTGILAAGLPNISGSIFIGCAVPDEWQTGALYSGFDSNPIEGWYNGEQPDCLSFDASRSNSTYGNSDTVQPPAITLVPQIKI